MKKETIERSGHPEIVIPGKPFRMALVAREGTVGDVLCLYERRLLIPSSLRTLRSSLNLLFYGEPSERGESPNYIAHLFEFCLFGEIAGGVARCIEFDEDKHFFVNQVELGDPWNQERDRVVWEEEKPSAKSGEGP